MSGLQPATSSTSVAAVALEEVATRSPTTHATWSVTSAASRAETR